MRTAIYVRVSTQRQAQTQTIDQQIDRLRSHVEAAGEAIPEENVLRDDGYSGATLKRPGLDRLRDQAAMAAFDRVVLTDPDRLARNYVHQVLRIEELQKHGCRVSSSTGRCPGTRTTSSSSRSAGRSPSTSGR